MKLTLCALLFAALAVAQTPTPTPVPLVIRTNVVLPTATYNLYRVVSPSSGCVTLVKPYPMVLASGSLATSPVSTSDAPGYGLWCYYATEVVNNAESLPSAPYAVAAATGPPSLSGQ